METTVKQNAVQRQRMGCVSNIYNLHINEHHVTQLLQLKATEIAKIIAVRNRSTLYELLNK